MRSYAEAIESIEDEMQPPPAGSGLCALSVRAAPGMAFDQLLQLYPLPNKFVRISMVGGLAQGAFGVKIDQEEAGHAFVVFDGMPSEQEWNLLVSLFSEPVLNPYPLPKKVNLE